MAKLNNNFIAVLDIGSAKVVCMIAKFISEEEISIVGIGHQVSEGVKSGLITDIKLAEESIRSAVGAAEHMAGINIDRVIVNISGNKQRSHTVKAELNIKGHEITQKDINRIISQGSELYNAKDEDVIHCIPVDYTIDGTSGIKSPLGMYGTILNATLHITSIASSTIRNLTSCLALCHLNIDGYISSAYASCIACLTEDEKELGVTLIDFGAGNTSIAIFKGGSMVFTETIAVGGNHITNDIAIGLSTSIETAERIKTLHGNAFKVEKDEHELIDLPQSEEDDETDMRNIQKSMLIGIIRPRIHETLEMVGKAINEYGNQKAGGKIVITGGASQLRGLGDLVEQTFNKPVRIGTPVQIEGMAESTKGPAFTTCAGMMMLAQKQISNRESSLINNSFISKGVVGKVFFWLKNNF